MNTPQNDSEDRSLILVRAACRLGNRQDAVKAALKTVSRPESLKAVREWAARQVEPMNGLEPDLDAISTVAEFLAQRPEKSADDLLVAVAVYVHVARRYDKLSYADDLLSAIAQAAAGEPSLGADAIATAEKLTQKSPASGDAKKAEEKALDQLITAVLNRSLSL